MKNYAEEIIPDFATLSAKLKEKVDGLGALEKYRFNKLFNLKNKEYRRNNDVLEGIGFNNRLGETKEERLKRLEDKNGKPDNEIKGVYVLFEKDVPVYVGISRGIIRRLKNHFIGKSHFSASLVYLMCRHEHDEKFGLYKKKREDLPEFINGREAMQERMRENWRISIISVDSHHEMYLLEFYLACELKTKWNSFETH